MIASSRSPSVSSMIFCIITFEIGIPVSSSRLAINARTRLGGTPSPLYPFAGHPKRCKTLEGQLSQTVTREPVNAIGEIEIPADCNGNRTSHINVHVCLKTRRFIGAIGVRDWESVFRRGSSRETSRNFVRHARGEPNCADHCALASQFSAMPCARIVCSGIPAGASILQR